MRKSVSKLHPKPSPLGKGDRREAVVEEEYRSTYFASALQFTTVIARSEATWQSIPFISSAQRRERIATPVCALVRNDREWETFHVFAEAFHLIPTAHKKEAASEEAAS